MIWVIYALLGFALFYVGVIVGVKQCKKHFSIPKGSDTEDIVIAFKPCKVVFDGDTTVIHYPGKGDINGSIND